MNHMNRRHLLTAALAGGALQLLGHKAVADAMPPRPTPEMWAKDPAMNGLSLSPDGNHVAYYKIEGGNKVLYHYDNATAKLSAFVVGPQEIASLDWIDGSHIAVGFYRALPNSSFLGLRNKVASLSLYNVAEKKVTNLFPSPGLARWAGGAMRIIRDGKPLLMTMAYAGEAMSDNSMVRCQLICFAGDTDHFEVIDTAGAEIENWVTAPDGEPVGRCEYYGSKKTWVLSYRRNGDWKDIYTYKGELHTPSLLGLGRDGKSLVVYLETENDDGQYFEVDEDGKFSDPLPAPGISRAALFDPVTFRLSGFATFDGWFSYHYFDPSRQALAAKAQGAVAGYRMSIIGQADDPNIMIVYSEGADDAGSNYLINFTTGATTDLGALYPDLPVEWLTTKLAIHYTAADGTDIEAYLTLPPGRDARNLPLVMHPHGGPAARDDLSYDWEVQAYASRGYAVLQPNFRGSTGYGHAFEHLGDGQVGRKMQTDLSDGVRFFAARGTIDPKRVCIVGTSYGGYAALAGAALDPGIYNCAVSIAGLGDATKWLEIQRGYTAGVNSPGYTYLLRLLGAEDTLDEISPVRHIDKINIPILIMHGKDDSIVPVNQSTDMVNALKSAGKNVAYFEVEHAEHGATTESSRIEIMHHTLDFIEKYNPPYLPQEAGA